MCDLRARTALRQALRDYEPSLLANEQVALEAAVCRVEAALYCARRHDRRGHVGNDDPTIPGQISARQCPVLLPQSSLSGRL